MGIVIGIDVGISTTKIVGIKNGKVSAPIRITAADPITSLYGAFGKYLHDNEIDLKEVEQVMLTGVGAAYIDTPIYGLPTAKSQEFVADGLGARFESKLDHTIVVSMGTGTSFVKCDGDEVVVHSPVWPVSCSIPVISSRWRLWPSRVISGTST